ncbi:MAG TPA: YdcF family protein [Acidimicrobiales bacterium]|nr:YdcF family protein [Acidimicrobiales bacterium]
MESGTTASDLALIDASAPGLAAGDLIFVFGTRLPTPAVIAADLYHDGLAPLIVVTGGDGRQADGLNEAHHHRWLLLERGVPESGIVVEDRSADTLENVMFSAPLIAHRSPDPMTVIAVVKRYHRRAVLTLAHHFPSVTRIYAVCYDPPLTDGGESERAQRPVRETAYVQDPLNQGFDPLVADGLGWRRSQPQSGRRVGP